MESGLVLRMLGRLLWLATSLSAFDTSVARAQSRAARRPDPVPQSVQRLAACYQLMMRDTSTRFSDLPARFVLTDTALATPFDGWYALEPRTLHARTRMFATWRPLARDSVDIGWSTGFTGFTLRGVVKGDTLLGYAERVSDARPRGSVPAGTSFQAVRVACRTR